MRQTQYASGMDDEDPDVWEPGDRIEHDRMVARLLVLAQMVLIGSVAAAAWAHGPGGLVWLGAGVAWAGVALGVWSAVVLGRGLTASPIPNGLVELRRIGPYRFVRHPMYSAVLTVGLGAVIWSGGWLTALCWALLAVLLRVKAVWEEHHLMEVFPGYEAYAGATPRFWAWPGRDRTE